MSRRIGINLLVTGLALLAACSGKSPKTESASESDLSFKTVRVVFDLPGDDIGGQESEEMLNRIRGEIVTRQLAAVMSSGFGQGNMEIVLRYGKSGSVEELRRTIQDIYPKGRYRIQDKLSGNGPVGAGGVRAKGS